MRGRYRLAVPEVERKLNPKEVRQEFAELQSRVGIHTLDRLPLALLHPLLESAPARGRHVGRHVQVAEVAERGLHLRGGRPSALLVELGETQLVGPHDGALLQAVVVHRKGVRVLVGIPDTDHDRHHVGEVRVASDGEAGSVYEVGPLLEKRVADGTADLQVLQVLEPQVHFIGHRPDFRLLGHPPRRHRKRNLILVVVVDEVRAEPHEDGQVSSLERLVGPEGLAMDEHAQALVHPHVKVDVPVGGTGIPILESTDLQLEGLLVELGLVGRGHVDLPDDAGRHDVVDGLAVSVLLHVDRRNGELRVGRIIGLDLLRTGQALLELPPFAPDELQTGEAQGHRLAPTLHEHPHEPDASEIADSTHTLLEVPDGHLELQPLDLLGLTIGHGLAGYQHIGQIVASNVGLRQVSRPQGNAVLEVALNRTQGQVFIEVLRVGEGGRSDGVALRLRRARVALVAVEEAVALQHILLVGLGHRIAEITEVVGGRVGPVGVVGRRIKIVLQPAQPVPEKLLLFL